MGRQAILFGRKEVSIPRFHVLVLTLVCAALLPAGVDDRWSEIYSQGQHAVALKDYANAETIYNNALKEAMRFGENDVRVATTLQGLGTALRNENKLAEAEAAVTRASAIYATASGEHSLEYAEAQFDLAGMLLSEGKYEQALQALNRLLPVFDLNLGPRDVRTAAALCMQGDSFRLLKRYGSAEPQLKRCADIRQEDAGVGTPEFGEAANSLAIVYQHLGKYRAADNYFKLAETIRETSLGITSPELAETLDAHAALLRQLGLVDEAKKKEKMAASIRAFSGKK
jgi:tetratricopeptide (TPR) repeat protein